MSNRLIVQAHEALIRFAIGDRRPVETFSQAGEDIVLASIFDGKITRGETGFYVDVGAYHPVLYSNTHYFHKRGWKGINIEPRPGSKAVFDASRPKDTNLEMAVSDHTGTVKFFNLSDTSTINTTTEDRVSKGQPSVTIPCDTLDKILASHASQSIDFVTIDVEGAEEAIVRSTDWQKWNPKVVVVEQSGSTLTDFFASPATAEMARAGYILCDIRRLYWPPADTLIRDTPASLFFMKS